MIGLYLGCNSNLLFEVKEEFKKVHKCISLPVWLPISGEFISLNNPISTQYKINEQTNEFLCIVGWFFYNGKLNDIDNLFEDISKIGEEALKGITGGVFIALFSKKESYFIFNDPMGLSNHYYFFDDAGIHLSPSITVFERDDFSLHLNQTLSDILDKRGYLFGQYTKYDGVKRLPPGVVLYPNKKVKPYIDLLDAELLDIEKVPARFSSIIEKFPKVKRQLPISGGLDSRLMLAVSEFTYGYCYGPKNSGDRPIARCFSHEFEQYEEFEFTSPKKKGNEIKVYKEITETPTSFLRSEFLASYRYASEQRPSANVIFDGYLGDTLQRGVYLNLGGALGEVFRFFPLLYTFSKLNAKFIMKRRYSNLSEMEFDILYHDFCNRTVGLELDDYAKVTYYEFLFGRGARFINNGALIMNGQYGIVVPIFSDVMTFNALIKEDFSKTVRFKTVDKIWLTVAPKFKKVKFENGYKIETSNFLKPKLALVWRLLARYIPGYGNYGNS